jgi:DNA-binding transcriptional regulator YdaS (Cro superfamily)
MLSDSQFGQAIADAGGVTKLAATLGVSAEALHNWRRRGIPANHCKAFAAATGLPLKWLRADWRDYWPELDTRPAALGAQ